MQELPPLGRVKDKYDWMGERRLPPARALRSVDTPPTLPRHLSTPTPRSCYRQPPAGCHENPEQLRALTESPRGDAGQLGMLSSWGRLGWRVESFGFASPTSFPAGPRPLYPYRAHSSCPACARQDQEHGASSDVAAEAKGMRRRRFADSQPPGRQARLAGPPG